MPISSTNKMKLKKYLLKPKDIYRLIKELNKELNDIGILTQGGVVRADYFRESLYVTLKPAIHLGGRLFSYTTKAPKPSKNKRFRG